MKKHALPLLVSLALFPACAKKKSDTQPAVATPPSIVGDYNAAFITDATGTSSPCYGGSLTSGSLTIALSYNDKGQVTQTITNYSDKSCQNSVFEVAATYNYRIDGAEDANKVLLIDYALAQENGQTGVKIRPMKDSLAFDWNRGRGHCGHSDWSGGQQRIVDPTMQGCLDEANVAFLLVPDTRTMFSRARLTDTAVLLYQPNGEDTGAEGHRASKQDNSVVYQKTGVQQPAQPTPGHNQPGDNVCPALGAAYDCDTQGEDMFVSRSVYVKANNIQGGTEFKLDLIRQGAIPASLTLEANGQSRIEGSDRRTDSCVRGELISRAETLRSGDNSVSRIVERRFRLFGPHQDLMIETKAQDANDPSHALTVSTQCRAR